MRLASDVYLLDFLRKQPCYFIISYCSTFSLQDHPGGQKLLTFRVCSAFYVLLLSSLLPSVRSLLSSTVFPSLDLRFFNGLNLIPSCVHFPVMGCLIWGVFRLCCWHLYTHTGKKVILNLAGKVSFFSFFLFVTLVPFVSFVILFFTPCVLATEELCGALALRGTSHNSTFFIAFVLFISANRTRRNSSRCSTMRTRFSNASAPSSMSVREWMDGVVFECLSLWKPFWDYFFLMSPGPVHFVIFILLWAVLFVVSVLWRRPCRCWCLQSSLCRCRCWLCQGKRRLNSC